MSVPLAYLGVILIWSTTPLTIKWSSEEVGFLFGVTTRMTIGLMMGVVLLYALRLRLPWHSKALHAYLAVGLPLYLAMTSVYWGAQFVSSGLVSVVFGLTPLFTGLIASLWIKEKSFTPAKTIGMLAGVLGLYFIFRSSMQLGEQAVLGIFGVLFASFMHSFSTVWIKAVNHSVGALEMAIGGLLIAMPLFSITWLLLDGAVPTHIPNYVGASIIYLGIVGSLLGAMLFFYALKHVDASKMALLTLITPVTALLLGKYVNHEVINADVITGCTIILTSLAVYHWADKWMRKIFSRQTING